MDILEKRLQFDIYEGQRKSASGIGYADLKEECNKREQARKKFLAKNKTYTYTFNEEETLRFQTNGFTHSFEAKDTGKYTIYMTYVRADVAEDEPVSVFFDLSYAPEYNSFLAFDVSEVHQFIRHRGQVTTDGTVDLSNSDDQVATYTIDFTILFAAAVVILFVIDIIIRKLKWSDIKGLFKKQAPNIKKGG